MGRRVKSSSFPRLRSLPKKKSCFSLRAKWITGYVLCTTTVYTEYCRSTSTAATSRDYPMRMLTKKEGTFNALRRKINSAFYPLIEYRVDILPPEGREILASLTLIMVSHPSEFSIWAVPKTAPEIELALSPDSLCCTHRYSPRCIRVRMRST